MKQIITALLLLLAIYSYGAIDRNASASLVKISTTDAEGKTIGQTTGFALTLVNENNETSIEIVAPYRIFKKATGATVTETKGKNLTAYRITGANELYDIIRFTTNKPMTQALKASTTKFVKGSKAYILQVPSAKTSATKEVTISEAQESGGLTYYTVATPADDAMVGSPILNANGEVVAVIQQNATKDKTFTYAIGIEFNAAIQVNTMSAGDASLTNVFIPKQLPEGESQAASYLYLLTKNTEDTLSYLANLGDFIAKYPDSPIGYGDRAQYYVATNQYALAEADYAKGLEMSRDKADIHYNMSTALYRLNQSKAYQQYKDWNLEKALSEIDEAYAINSTPLYLMHKGKCLYAMKRYDEAYNVYGEINNTKFCSSENLFFQARSLEMAGGDSTQIIALLDSAVNRFIRPLRPDAAPYVLYRAQHYFKYGMYSKAYFDFQDYEDVVGTNNVNDKFYFMKEQAALNANFYPQALIEIGKAINANPKQYDYYIEKAMIEVRMGNFEDAAFTATQAQKINSTDPDSYFFIGISQIELGNKAEARKNLQKALELGRQDAQTWLDKIK